MATHHEKPKPIEHYQEWFDRANLALHEHAKAYPHAPLTDPAWQEWIRKFKTLSSKQADAFIAWTRQIALHELEERNING